MNADLPLQLAEDLVPVDLTEEQLFAPLTALFNQKITKFPGTLPESLDSKNVQILRYGYVCALKADGDRVFCLLEGSKMRMLRRNKQYKTFGLSFDLQTDFIFDAEWIEDLHLLLLFDTLLFANQPCWRLNYTHRLELAKYFLTTMIPDVERHMYESCYIHDPPPLPSKYQHGVTWQSPSFQVQVKPVYAPEHVAQLWNNRSLMRYNCDGIIFTRLWCTYRPFCEPTQSVMKWKPCVTIDFYVAPLAVKETVKPQIPSQFEPFICPENQSTCNVVLQSVHDGALCNFSYALIRKKVLELCLGKICEFRWNMDLSAWIVERARLDKTSPNTLVTVFACLQSICDKLEISDIAPLFDTSQPLHRKKKTQKLNY